ncbi:MAG: hypothetical protein DMF86_24745 [Acidobacteria bacterium]|nr:MAG: hypothetical protein DMF86_24745 [Acidobacteriota bacterium]
MAFANQPKILKSAFVEFGISLPPLVLVFQFNPLTVTRTRAAKPVTPASQQSSRASQNAGLVGGLVASGTISVDPETIGFDIRLDATDKLNDGDGLTEQFGISPQLATLEAMMLPKGQSLLGGAVSALLGASASRFLCLESIQDPPVILWVWGRKKILPVNILNMQIKEEQFSTDLNPTRAIITVQLQVIEGPNVPYLYSKAMQEVMSVLNLVNIGDLSKTMVPA